jgi:hypothetical protein
MEIGRRELLAGVVTLSLAKLAPSLVASPPGDERPASTVHRWHPLTRSLPDRASRAGQRLHRSRVERIIHEVSEEHGRPVIKWMESPARAFEHLSRYPLNDLMQMGTARFWPVPPPFVATNEDAAERSFELYWQAIQVLRAEEHDRALMAPKLMAKQRSMAVPSVPRRSLRPERLRHRSAGLKRRCPPLRRKRSALLKTCSQPDTLRARWRYIIS